MPAAPLRFADFTEKDKQRFWSKVDKNGPLPDQSDPNYAGLGPCWVWTSALSIKNYGLFMFGVTRKAHRVSWLLSNGTIAEGHHVLHRCDNSRCCNPSHLFTGTNNDNMRDRDAKGRVAFGEKSGTKRHPEKYISGRRRIFGEHHGFSKLTDAIVTEMRIRHQRGETAASLGREFGVKKQTADAVISGRTWRHVPL